jgi:hypothetical protein
MSWLYSQALVEEYSAGTSLAGEPCAQLNVMPTPHKFWRSGKTMDCSDLSRFGLTLRILTENHGAGLLMSYLGAFPVRTSAPPARGLESMENAADCGWRWPASFAKYDPDTSSWRTRQCSLAGGLDAFSETWPAWGSMRHGECLARITPVLLTREKDSGFVPTPTASNTKAFTARGADKGKQREPRSYGAHGPLNPRFLEWLMAWPVGWTKLEPLETARFQEWQRQHSSFFPMSEAA